MPERDDWTAAVDGMDHRPAPGEPSDNAGQAMAVAAGRAMIQVVACRSCGSARMRRASSHGTIAWWKCVDCGSGQREGLLVGRNTAHF
jgi:transposase-like protein